MQALLLLAGESSRMYPLNLSGHKAMISIHGKPLCFYTLTELRDVGIKDFIFIIGQKGKEIQEYFGDGIALGVNIKYAIQKLPKGQADAIMSARHLIHTDFIVINPYYFNFGDILSRLLEKFSQDGVDGIIPGIYEENIWDYGAISFDENFKIRYMVEKPEIGKEPSFYRRTLCDICKLEWLEVLKTVMDATYPNFEAINLYSKDHNVFMYEIDRKRYIPSLKYPWHILTIRSQLSKFMMERFPQTTKWGPGVFISENVSIEESAEINGCCYIGPGVVIKAGSKIVDSDIARGVTIQEGSHIIDSVIMENTSVGRMSRVSSSIIGRSVNIGEHFRSETFLNGDATVKSMVKGKKIDTHRSRFGVVVGENVVIGDNIITKPGVFIDAVIPAGKTIKPN